MSDDGKNVKSKAVTRGLEDTRYLQYFKVQHNEATMGLNTFQVF